MYRLALAVAVTLCGSVVVGQDNASEQDLKAFQGTWKVTSMMWGGKEEVRGKVQDAAAVIAGNEITVTVEKDNLPKAVFKLDATKMPKTIDLGQADQKTFPNQGIYELKGDTLTLCWGGGGKPRPTKLASTEKGDERLLVLQRVKK
jgi:uncharacterized protein (TIGR03067 family)